MHLRYLYILLSLFVPGIAGAQNPSLEEAKKHHVIIFKEDQPKPQVLLLGLFHFAGEQVDANTTPVNLRVNMLSPERQEQIEHLVKKLAEFKPTKIAIEGLPQHQHYFDSLYQAYCKGVLPANPKLQADERIQLAFRLARMLKLDRLYPVDAQTFRFNLSPLDSVLTYEKYKDQADTSLTYWNQRYAAEKTYMDSLAFFLPLNEYLQYLNSPEIQAKTIGRWLIATKRGTNTEPVGADGFITRYFNRNLRIYSNIQRIVTDNTDRILVIYGATHMYILKQLFNASPEFKLRDILDYLK